MSRTILVTGSANGIGQATANYLRERGHTVIGLDLAGSDIDCDLGTADGCAAAVARVIALCGGKLNAVIACAVVAGQNVEAMIGVNYFGTVRLIEGLRDTLGAAPAPRVVAITSSASILPSDPELVAACLDFDETTAISRGHREPTLVYASTKLALSRWIRRTAKQAEWAGRAILLNGIAPGTVITDMTRPILATAEGRAMLAQVTPIAVPAYAGPEDIAPLLAFLAGEECRYMVGQIIFIDGGKDVIRRGEDIFG